MLKALSKNKLRTRAKSPPRPRNKLPQATIQTRKILCNKGGMPMAKKKTTSTAYAYGGMAKAKPRTGNTDYRMGGMFMKNGKK